MASFGNSYSMPRPMSVSPQMNYQNYYGANPYPYKGSSKNTSKYSYQPYQPISLYQSPSPAPPTPMLPTIPAPPTPPQGPAPTGYVPRTRQTVHILLQNISTIIPASPPSTGGLYLGNIIAIMLPTYLAQNNITAILSVGDNAVFDPNECDYKAVVATKAVTIRDTVDYPIQQHFQECTQWIDEQMAAGRNILVHCHAGVSRSATIVIAYLMKKNAWGYEQAYAYTKGKRDMIKPNQGFVKQLKEYEITLAQKKNQLPQQNQQTEINRIYQSSLKISRQDSTLSRDSSIKLQNPTLVPYPIQKQPKIFDIDNTPESFVTPQPNQQQNTTIPSSPPLQQTKLTSVSSKSTTSLSNHQNNTVRNSQAKQSTLLRATSQGQIQKPKPTEQTQTSNILPTPVQTNHNLHNMPPKPPRRTQTNNIKKTLVFKNLGGLCSFDDNDLAMIDSDPYASQVFRMNQGSIEFPRKTPFGPSYSNH